MAIFWSEKMSVGNQIIDEQHKYLICLINSIDLALKIENSEALEKMLEKLEEYTVDHFKMEEALQKKIKFPDYRLHHEQHRKILNDLDEIKGRASSPEWLDAPVSEVNMPMRGESGLVAEDQVMTNRDYLTELLRRWIIDHVINSDLKMKVYFQEYPRNFA